MKAFIILLLCLAILAGCASGLEPITLNHDEFVTQVDRKPPVQPEHKDEKPLTSLNEILRYAAIHNPALESAFEDWKAAIERTIVDGSLPDPRFTFTYFIEEVETRVGPQEQRISIAQTFPWFGKLQLQSDVAAATANAQRHRYDVVKLRLFYHIKKTYYDYYYLSKSIGITNEHMELMTYLEHVARARYKVASGSHPDIIRAQLELGKLEDQLRSLKDLQEPIRVKLNTYMNRPPHMPIPFPTIIPDESPVSNSNEIMDLLDASNPELKALNDEVATHRARYDLAGKSYYPDITLGVDSIRTGTSRMSQSDSGDDPMMIMLSVNLPLWQSTYRAMEREAQAGIRSSSAQKTNMRNTLHADAAMALYHIRDNDRKINLFKETLIPKGEQSLKATETAFKSGQSSFLDMIDSQRALLDFNLSYERALSEKARYLAELDMIVGETVQRKTTTKENKK